MDWKETVMKSVVVKLNGEDTELEMDILGVNLPVFLKTQAEISYKAGYKAHEEWYKDEIEIAKKKERERLLDYYELALHTQPSNAEFIIHQALKGIEKERNNG